MTKEEKKAYNKIYNATPEAKAKQKARNATPERKAFMKAYTATPERKATVKAYTATPERKATVKAYLARPEVKIREKEYKKEYRKKPEVKIRQKSYNDKYVQKHHEKVRINANTWQKKKCRQNKLKAIAYLGGHCADCKNEFPPYVYEFHHLDPTIKEFNVSLIMGRKWEGILPELKKCVLLCANCHKIRENKEDYS